MLKFQIVSSRTVEGFEKDKKFVAYMVQARQATESRVLDPDPANVERRYTHFLDLYHGLKKEFPALLSGISFPRKIVMGNFDPNLISTRCTAFESLLELIAGDSRLRDTPAAIMFFQEFELNEAKQLINEGKFDQALSVLETSFKLLNKFKERSFSLIIEAHNIGKVITTFPLEGTQVNLSMNKCQVYTDRSRVVLGALCRIVACAGASDGTLAGPVERWAQLALKRYEAVSDSDLLLIYVPLLHTCISIWETLGRDKSKLVEELNDLRKRGMKVDSVPSLMEAVDSLTTV